MKPTAFVFALACSAAIASGALAKDLATVKDVLRFAYANPHQALEHEDYRFVVHPYMNVVVFLSRDTQIINVAQFRKTDTGEIYLSSMDREFLNEGPWTGDRRIDARILNERIDLPILHLLDAFEKGPVKAFDDVPAGTEFHGHHTLRFPDGAVGTWAIEPTGKRIIMRVPEHYMDVELNVKEFANAQ